MPLFSLVFSPFFAKEGSGGGEVEEEGFEVVLGFANEGGGGGEPEEAEAREGLERVLGLAKEGGEVEEEVVVVEER